MFDVFHGEVDAFVVLEPPEKSNKILGILAVKLFVSITLLHISRKSRGLEGFQRHDTSFVG